MVLSNFTEIYRLGRAQLTPEHESWLKKAAKSGDKSVAAMTNLCLGLVCRDRGDRWANRTPPMNPTIPSNS